MLHGVKNGVTMLVTMRSKRPGQSVQSIWKGARSELRLQQAARRARGDQGLLEKRRDQLGERLRQIASTGPRSTTGQRYVLAQNVGSAISPLWVRLCVADQEVGQLVFSGNRMPVEFAEAEAIELAPQLGAFLGAVEFQKVEGVRA